MEPADLMLVSFKEHLRVETVPAEAVCLVSERGVTALSGPSIEKVAPLLDGTRTVSQVKRELSADLPAGEVGGLLARLSDAGLLAYFPARTAGRRDGRLRDDVNPRSLRSDPEASSFFTASWLAALR